MRLDVFDRDRNVAVSFAGFVVARRVPGEGRVRLRAVVVRQLEHAWRRKRNEFSKRYGGGGGGGGGGGSDELQRSNERVKVGCMRTFALKALMLLGLYIVRTARMVECEEVERERGEFILWYPRSSVFFE